MKVETNIKNNQKKILFIDKELLPIFGFKSIADYEHLITQKSLNKIIIAKINELLPKITEMFPKKLFNLHKTDNKVQTTKQSFNLLKKCLTDANIPYSEWTKRVDDKNINYMRLETINNVLYDYIKNMQEIQQKVEVKTEETTPPSSAHKIPEKVVYVSELYKKAKAYKKYENIICSFHQNENGKISINISELFIKETCDKSISLQFIEKEKYFSTIKTIDESVYDTTPLTIEVVSGHDEYLLVKEQNYKPSTNILPENTVVPLRNLCYYTTNILITPPKNMDITKYFIGVKVIATENKNILTDFYNGKFQLIFDTFKSDDLEYMGCFFENGRLSPINIYSTQPKKPIVIEKPKKPIKFHVLEEGKVTTYDEDVYFGVTDDIKRKHEMFGEIIHKGKYEVLRFNNILDTNSILWHKFKCIEDSNEIVQELTYQETTQIRNVSVQSNCVMVRDTIRHHGDTCSGIVFCFEKDLGDVSFDISNISEAKTLKHKKITNDEYKKEFHTESPFGDTGVNYKILGININNQVNLVGNPFYEAYINFTIPKEQMKSLMSEFSVVKSYMCYWGEERKKVAQAGGLIVDVFSDILN